MRYRATKLLIADLSSTRPKDMRQVVAAFRQQQNPNVVDDVDHFRLIRLSLLDGILPLHYITIVKTNLTDSIPLDSHGR
jgi:hydroxyethylthiazole kinase-like sugar kinase family protein